MQDSALEGCARLTHPTFLTPLAAAILAIFAPGVSHANPHGGQVMHGQAGFNASVPGQLTVTNSPGAIINWQSFGIQQHEVTRFVQQNAQSTVLNRVVGQDPSQILGQLLSNGRVFVINPNGILVGEGARIDTAGFVASTLNLTDENFLQGLYRFAGGKPDSQIENRGLIHATGDGSIVLIAPNIQNEGVLKTEGGNVLLAAGQSLTLTSIAAPEVQFEIQAPQNQAVNLGQIITQGGAAAIFAGSIRHAGTIDASSATLNEKGEVQLVAQGDVTLETGSTVRADGPNGGDIRIESQTGTTLVAGTVEAKGTTPPLPSGEGHADELADASAIGSLPPRGRAEGEGVTGGGEFDKVVETDVDRPHPSLPPEGEGAGKGGTVHLLGEHVGLLAGAKVDASGEKGGGEILVGGDYQGRNPDIHNAKAAYVSRDAVVLADALTWDDGGKVIVWSDDATRVYGQISAKGGAEGGNGGFIETSGHWLDTAGIRVDASAPRGLAGSWLLDPYDITIGASSANIDTSGNPWLPTASGSTVANTAIQTTLDGGTDVTIYTGGASTGTEAGNITVAANINTTPSADATLTLKADNAIIVNGGGVSVSIAAAGSNKLNVVFNADADSSGAGSISIDGGSSVQSNGGNIVMGGGACTVTGCSGYAAGFGTGAGPGIYLSSGPTSRVLLDSAGGDIILRGQGASGAAYGRGIEMPYATLSSGAGSITLDGAGGGNDIIKGPNTQGTNTGVWLSYGSVLSTTGGDITVTGTGGTSTGSSTENSGIEITGGQLSTSGAGRLTLTGIGGTSTSQNYGVLVSGSSLSTASGALTVSGTGGNGTDQNYGVYLDPTVNSLITVNGDLTVIGHGGGTGNNNDGILSYAQLSATGSGNLLLTGTAGNGVDQNTGVAIHGSTGGYLSTNGGDLTVTGIGKGSGASNLGIYTFGIAASPIVLSTQGSGKLTLDGTGGGTTLATSTNSNYGVWLNDYTHLTSANGKLSVTGTGGQGSGIDNHGISTGNITVQSALGDMAFTGYGGTGTDNNIGVYVNSGGSYTTGGKLSIHGTGGGSGVTNYGIEVSGSNLSITGSGTLSLDGTGGNGTGSNYGIILNSGSVLSTVDGDLSVTGRGGQGSGSSNSGIGANATLSTTGTGTLRLTGTGGSGTDSNSGVEFGGGGGSVASLTTTQGDLIVTGTGGDGTGNNNMGIWLPDAVLQTGTGNLVLSGTGGNGINNNVGVYLRTISAPTSLSTGGGNLSITGIGGFNPLLSPPPSSPDGWENIGIMTYGAFDISLSAGGAGSLTLTGTGGNGNAGYNIGVWFYDSQSHTVLTTAGGPLTVDGTGNGSGGQNFGIYSAYANLNAGSGVLTLRGLGSDDSGLRLDASNIGGAGQSGDVIIEAGNVSALDRVSASSTSIHGTGNLILRPLSAGDSIGLAGGAGLFNLDATELGGIQNGFGNITIGRTDGTGLITYGSGTGSGFTFLDPLTLRNAGTGSAGILITDPLGTGSNPLTFDSRGTVDSTSILTSGGLNLTGGTLLNVSGGSLTVAGPTSLAGALTVSGTGSAQLNGALSGAGTVNVSGGTLTLNGNGSGFGGAFNLSGGTTGVNNLLTLGALNLSGGTLDGAGALTVTGPFNVTGAATLSGAGTFVTQGTSLIDLVGTGSALTLSGGETWINQGTLTLGGDDAIILSGATLTNAAGGALNLASSHATPLQGGTVNNAGTLNQAATGTHAIGSTFDNTGTANVNAGTLDVAGTFATNSGTIDVASGATFRKTGGFANAGTIQGSGTLDVGAGNTLANNGTLSPGGTGRIGTLSLIGNLTQGSAGILNIDLGGTGAGQSDQLAVTGNVTLGGALNARLLGGYTPVNSDATPFLTLGGTAAGTFATVNVPTGFAVGYNLFAGEAARLIYADSTTDIFINGAGTLDWSNPLNWSRSALPGKSDEALIETGFAVSHASGDDLIRALTIKSGNALALSGGTLTVLEGTSLDGSLSISGAGRAELDGALSGAGVVNVGGGTLRLKGDGSAFAGRVTVADSGLLDLGDATFSAQSLTLSQGGILHGSGTFNGNLFNDSGVFSPGHSPGLLSINGNYTQGANGQFLIEIGGATRGGGYDALNISGDATFAGTVQFLLVNGFLPTAGEQFNFLNVGGLFTNHASLLFPNGYTFSFVNGWSSVTGVPGSPIVLSSTDPGLQSMTSGMQSMQSDIVTLFYGGQTTGSSTGPATGAGTTGPALVLTYQMENLASSINTILSPTEASSTNPFKPVVQGRCQ